MVLLRPQLAQVYHVPPVIANQVASTEFTLMCHSLLPSEINSSCTKCLSDASHIGTGLDRHVACSFFEHPKESELERLAETETSLESSVLCSASLQALSGIAFVEVYMHQ